MSFPPSSNSTSSVSAYRDRAAELRAGKHDELDFAAAQRLVAALRSEHGDTSLTSSSSTPVPAPTPAVSEPTLYQEELDTDPTDTTSEMARVRAFSKSIIAAALAPPPVADAAATAIPVSARFGGGTMAYVFDVCPTHPTGPPDLVIKHPLAATRIKGGVVDTSDDRALDAILAHLEARKRQLTRPPVTATAFASTGPSDCTSTVAAKPEKHAVRDMDDDDDDIFGGVGDDYDLDTPDSPTRLASTTTAAADDSPEDHQGHLPQSIDQLLRDSGALPPAPPSSSAKQQPTVPQKRPRPESDQVDMDMDADMIGASGGSEYLTHIVDLADGDDDDNDDQLLQALRSETRAQLSNVTVFKERVAGKGGAKFRKVGSK